MNILLPGKYPVCEEFSTALEHLSVDSQQRLISPPTFLSLIGRGGSLIALRACLSSSLLVSGGFKVVFL